MKQIIIIGAGAAGLCAALTVAESGRNCVLISASPSERAQSNLAAGGINAAVGDEELFAKDTLASGENLANNHAVEQLTEHAEETLAWLRRQGVPFQMEQGVPALRRLGGHTQSRTRFAGSITGKAIMSALIDQVRKYEALGLIERKSHHVLTELLIDHGQEEKNGSETCDESATGEGSVCHGCIIRNRYNGEVEKLQGPVILASGGMSGLFNGNATGVRENDADVTAIAFQHGVDLGNLEFIQYHPTTISIPGKQCLISEAARSEGGRLFVEKDNTPWYFLEEMHGSEGNLISRDQVVKDFWNVRKMSGVSDEIYLDMRGISDSVWEDRLSCLRELCLEYLNRDPKREPIPIREGIHYFMGGILVDEGHRTNIKNLYAAGECSCIYHGANRLGGNSLLGAVYGGKTAAKTAMTETEVISKEAEVFSRETESLSEKPEIMIDATFSNREKGTIHRRMGEILCDALAVVRDEEGLRNGWDRLKNLSNQTKDGQERRHILLGMAMIQSALSRKESRGAHIRMDYPEKKEEYQKVSVARYRNGRIELFYQTP